MVGGKIAAALSGAGHRVSITYLNNKKEVQDGYPLDVSDGKELERLVRKLEPDLIVNAAALPSVDQCDKDEKRAFAVNSEPQRVIAEHAKPKTCIAYISTSNVFGSGNKPWAEGDTPAPPSVYGRTKLQGEKYTMMHKRHLILRSDQIYGWTAKDQKKTFVERCLEKMERNEPVEVCSDWYNCPTYADDIAIAIEKLFRDGESGIFHAVGPTYLNRVGWAGKIALAFGHDPKLVKAIDSSILNLPAKRSNCALDNGKIVRTTGHRFLSVDEGLAIMKAARNIRHP